MMEYSEDDYLSLSGIQHFSFCKRQWALIHVEQQWEENVLTVQGNILHEKAHDASFNERRGSLLTTRAMPIKSRSLAITGECDVVEFHRNDAGIELFGKTGKFKPIPVEYKRGKSKTSNADRLQLCAQALCLEEMLVCDIEVGYIFYHEVKKREEVILTQDLRNEVKEKVLEMHSYYDRRYTPKVKTTKQCKSCSLADICLPVLCKSKSVEAYIKKMITEDM